MPEQPTIAERIELVQEAVRKWRYLCRNSHLARSRQFYEREAWADTTEIISAYEDHTDEKPYIDPNKKQEYWSPQYLDLRAALPVEEVLRNHGKRVAIWLAQQQIPDRDAVALFLRYRKPDFAERADAVLAIARVHALANQEGNNQPSPTNVEAPPGAKSDNQPPKLTETETPHPKWDRPSRQITIDNQPITIARREAPVQFAILDALENAGWPVEGVPPPQFGSVKDAVDALNATLSSTRLRILKLNGNKQISWKLDPI
jgi:hypothetical protein